MAVAPAAAAARELTNIAALFLVSDRRDDMSLLFLFVVMGGIALLGPGWQTTSVGLDYRMFEGMVVCLSSTVVATSTTS